MVTVRRVIPPSLLFLFLLILPTARADTIIVTIGAFTGPVVTTGFPLPAVTIGTFTFTIPAGQGIVSATIIGQFGLTGGVDTTAAVDVRIDGLLVAECAPLSVDGCAGDLGEDNPFGPFPWTFSIPTSEFGLLADGSAVLTATQLAPFALQLDRTTLTITTEAGVPLPAPIPEPDTLVLLGTGLSGLAALIGLRLRSHRR